ncbi:hypothetical protein PSHT_03122 [Puccinia striiformis]|uniref:GH18 domain-containing protein n=1 Tax=Puccinia striiformis TaxID=27350 RepID=A0A2S4WG89_9BASI|nr:hypothetical protein PSHT_03122 [Puccinia striiformis]
MRSPCPTLLEAFLLVALLIAVNTDARRAKGEPKVKGYYPTYNSEAQPPSKIDWAAYTDVLYFMVIPQADGSLSFDPALTPSQGEKLVTEFVSQARKPLTSNHLRRREPSSQYGWLDRLTVHVVAHPDAKLTQTSHLCRHFSNLTATAPSRKRFAQVLVNFAKKHGFTGLEMDWEYPNGDGIGCNSRNPDDVVNFGLLTKELRTLWPEVELTAAVGITGLNGADGSPATPKETALLTANLDYINLMAYDVFGSWSETTGPIAPLYALVPRPVALKQGFKASQVLLGIPGYAKRSELASPKLVPKVVGSHTTLYYQKPTGVTPPGGKFDDKPGKDICGNAQKWGGSFLVTELISNGWLSKDQKTGLKGYKRYFDECSGQPFLSNGKYLISYDDKDSTIAKAKFAKKNNMGGIYFFDTMGPPADTLQEARKIFS